MECYTMLTMVVAVVSAIGSLLAAFAALRSAGIAKDAIAQAENLERARLEREASLICNRVVAGSMRVDGLANQLKMEYQSLSAFAGQTGGSRQQAYTKEVEKTQGAVGHMQGEARKVLEDRAALKARTNDELVETIVKMEGYVVQLDRVKEKFIHEVDSIEANNRLYRERALRGPGGGLPPST